MTTAQPSVSSFAILLRMVMEQKGHRQHHAAAAMNEIMERQLGRPIPHFHLSTSQASVSKWLDGENGPNRKKFPMLAEYCGVSLGVIERLCGDASESDDVGVLREALVDERTERRVLEVRCAELTEQLHAEHRAKLRAQRERTQLREAARQAEARVAEAERDLAELRAQIRAATPKTRTPPATPRRRHAAAS